MAMIQFVSNYEDLSTDKGYQFKFYCDKCGNGYMSRFQPSITGTAGSLLRAAGDMFGGWLGNAGNSAYEIQRAVGGKAHDEALQRAVEEGKTHFHQCSRCGRWVCPEVCWNAAAGQCEGCAPDFNEEMASAHAQAKADAARQCSSCGADVGKAKFCPECGSPTAPPRLTCTGCGHQPEGSPKFCPECGGKMSVTSYAVL